MQAFFNAMSGMLGYSRGLDVVSNNIANMNTPGFYGRDPFFRSISGEQPLGMTMAGDGMRTSPGDIQQTGQPLDLAIKGAGFFVLRDESGALFYTRAGQLEFNKDNVLVERTTGYEVVALSGNGVMEKIDITEQKTRPAQATTSVKLTGTVALPLTGGTATPITVQNIKAYDASGAVHTLKLVMTRDNTTPNAWKVEITDESGAVISSPLVRVTYDAAGTPSVGANTVTATLATGGQTQEITFNFGDPGSFAGTHQSPGGVSNVSAQVVDGHGIEGLRTATFDENGVLVLTYTGGEEVKSKQLALASFPDQTALQQRDGSLFQTGSGMPAEYGHPGGGVFGLIQSGSIQVANVDLVREMAKVMMFQRGYQASSRAMNVANEMIQQLFDGTKGG